jgi:hypothetical protein
MVCKEAPLSTLCTTMQSFWFVFRINFLFTKVFIFIFYFLGQLLRFVKLAEQRAVSLCGPIAAAPAVKGGEHKHLSEDEARVCCEGEGVCGPVRVCVGHPIRRTVPKCISIHS